jgi:hypothetical protein
LRFFEKIGEITETKFIFFKIKGKIWFQNLKRHLKQKKNRKKTLILIFYSIFLMDKFRDMSDTLIRPSRDVAVATKTCTSLQPPPYELESCNFGS